MAREERNPLVRVQLYQLLGGVRDERLARRALDLALTEEPGATNASQIISSVAAVHPDLAFDFALANRERVEALVDASSRSRYLAALGAGSSDPAMIDKLDPICRAPHDRPVARARPTAPSPGSATASGCVRSGCPTSPAGWRRGGARRRRASSGRRARRSRGEDERRRSSPHRLRNRSPTDGERRVAARASDDAGEGDAEQAFADDQAGRGQHAHPLGEFGIGAARPAQRS